MGRWRTHGKRSQTAGPITRLLRPVVRGSC
jgi:hypothetical protein